MAGTLITRHLAIEAADLGLITLFATIGTLLSLAINSWLISQALRPLRQLRQMVDELARRHGPGPFDADYQP